MYSAVVAMLSRFNIVMIHIDKKCFPYKISFKRYLPDDLYHLNYHVEELCLKLILCISFTVICNFCNISRNGFRVLVRSQILCSYMDDKAIRVTFQWRLHVCIFCCRSAEMLHYNFFLIIR